MRGGSVLSAFTKSAASKQPERALRYDVLVHPLAQRLLSHLRQHELLRPGERVGVGVSGGIDSVALLRLLLELRGEVGIVLSVVHFNHKLRGGESDGDEQFVADLARQFDLEFQCDGGGVLEHARTSGISVETAARELRYGFFRQLLGNQEVRVPTLSQNAREGRGNHPGFDKIVTGHTLDDQAETVLMRIIRGAGLKGLGGIHPRLLIEGEHGEAGGEIVRPLLPFRRRELESYLKDIGQSWREDATNADTSFTRNRVRKLLVPLLEKEFNPAVAESLAELAEIARGEEDFWETEVAGWMGTGVHWAEPAWAKEEQPGDLVQIAAVKRPGNQSDPELRSKIAEAPWLVMNASVDLLWFLGEPAGVQRRVVKAIGEHAGIPLEFKHVEEILRFAEEHGSGKELSLPLGWRVERRLSELVILTPDLREPAPATDYEYALPVPGCVDLYELGLRIETRCVPSAEDERYNPEHLLDAGSLTGPLKVRNWRAGDRFWPQHTKSPKKIKELLQERHVPQPERKLWPVVVMGEQVVWLRGFPPPARLAAKSGCAAVVILETYFGDSDHRQ